MVGSELQLFVLWEKARHIERRILEDIKKNFEVVCARELRIEGPADEFYRKFYGPALPDAHRKVRLCGAGPYLLVVVRDVSPVYGEKSFRQSRNLYNVKLVELKNKYRTWAGGGHRIHGTLDAFEFARDIYTLTGRRAEEWVRGVPPEPWGAKLPDGWGGVRSEDAGNQVRTSTVYLPDSGGHTPSADWKELMNREGRAWGLAGCELFIGAKTLNDCFYRGKFRGRPCLVKCSTKAVRSIQNEFMRAQCLYAEVPQVVAEPLAFFITADGRMAFSVTAWIEGPSLTQLLARGLTEPEADRYAADIRTLARALRQTGLLHRDLFADNLLLGEDGHLKAIDWQLAIERNRYREDPWVAKNWKFRYVVFGVNRELGLGVWNDFHALGKILAQFPQTETVKAVSAELAALMPEMTFAAPPKGLDHLRLWLYGCSLRLQMVLNCRRPERYARLERRWRTVRCKWNGVKST